MYQDAKVFELIHQVQDRTSPSITLIPHKINVEGKDLLVLEIPFSPQLHRTSRGEFLIRSNDGNRPIEPYEMATIMSEKGLIVYDQKTWKVSGEWMDSNLRKIRQDIPATETRPFHRRCAVRMWRCHLTERSFLLQRRPVRLS